VTLNVWQGDKVRLRAMEPEDWKVFHASDLDSEVARLCYEVPFPRSEEGSRLWADATARAVPHDDIVRLVVENGDGVIVGTLNTFECNLRCGTFKYGIAIMREYWGRGYATDAIRLLLRHYFHELRYQKVTVHIYDFNAASLHLHEKLGFVHEGRLRNMVFTDGAYHDEIIMGQTVDEYDRTPRI
jgi:RimJ/RimL family protein N-acetyltransferase